MAAPCNKCHSLLPTWDAVNSDDATCVFCGASSTVRVFPALFQRVEEPVAPAAAAEGEGACFDHPAKRATAHCSQCGRFLCALCAVNFRGAIWCPSCITLGAAKKRAIEFENGRTLFDSIALCLAIWPLILWPFTFISAPAALFVGVGFWRRPLSLIRRNHWRAVLAIILSMAQIGGWVWVIVYLIARAGTKAAQ